MEKLKKLLDNRLSIARACMIITPIIASITFIACVALGMFVDLEAISIISAFPIALNIVDAITWTSFLDLVFVAGTVVVLFLEIKRFSRNVDFMKKSKRAIKCESDPTKYIEGARQGLLDTIYFFTIYSMVGYAILDFKFSLWAVICVVVLIACFAVSTFALIFVEETIPSVAFASIEGARYILSPTICCLIFKLLCPAGLVRKMFYGMSAFFNGLRGIGDAEKSEATRIISQTICNSIVEPFLIAFLCVWVAMLVFSVLDELNPKREGASLKPPVYRFKRLSVFLAIATAFRLISGLILTTEGIKGLSISSAFGLVRNDFLPALALACAGYLLLEKTYEWTEEFLPKEQGVAEESQDKQIEENVCVVVSSKEDKPQEKAPEPILDKKENDAQEKGQIFCKFCGKKIDSDSVFCLFCGQKIK